MEIISAEVADPTLIQRLGILSFIPNLIGYARFAALFAALYFAFDPNRSYLFVVCYGLSQAFDGVDGWAARKFD